MKPEYNNHLSGEKGFTLMEFLVVFSMVSILTGVAVTNMRILESPLENAAFQVNHYLRLVRSRAISTTSYIIVQPSTDTTLRAYSSDSCTGGLTEVTELTTNFPDETSLATTDWEVCFTPRGLSPENDTFDIQNSESRTKTFRIALGGGVKFE